jgi:hypothetical protein
MSIFSVFKDKSFEKLITQFDTSFSAIPTNNTTDTSDNLVGQAINQAILSADDDSTNVHSLFNSLSVSSDRLSRYATYTELFSAVQLIKRIVVLYLNNVCLRDPITNKILVLKSTEESTDIGTEIEYRAFCTAFIQFYDLEDRIRSKTAPDVLKFGDSFIEVINLDDYSPKFPRSPLPNKKSNKFNFISEQEFLKKLHSKNEYTNITSDDIINLLENYIQFTDEVDTEDTLLDSIQEEEKIKLTNNPYNFSKVLLKFHKPHNIIPLITEYDNILGYVEITENSTPANGNRTNNLLNFANMINQVSSTSYIGGDTRSEKKENVLKLFVDSIVLKILNKYNINDTSKYKTEKEYSEYLKKSLKPDILDTLKRLLINADENALFKNTLKVRFISSNNVFHFKNPGTGTFYPFGDSVIDPLIFPGKLYLLTQLANAVTRLSRSSIMRKWTIETGSREDVNGLLQKLKRNLKNQRVTGDDIATSKNLPRILSDYKDMVTFKKKGATFIDLDVLPSGDPNVNIRDLEDLRKELISLSGVPSSYLGYQDVVDLKDQLVHANVVFANDVSAVQKVFNDNLTKLAARVSEIIGFKSAGSVVENIQISLIAPTVLVLQAIEASINSISNIQRIFAEIPEIDVDPLYLLKRYSPMIDWDEFEKEAQDFKQRKQVSVPTATNTGGQFGGSGGGY